MEPIQTDVAVVTDPAPEASGSQTSTLGNLDVNIANELGLQTPAAPVEGTDTSTGEAPVSTKVPPEPPAATEPEIKESEAEAEAKATRLSQDNSNLRTTLTKLGVDPDGSTAEQLRTGIITFDDILRTKEPVQIAQKPDATAPAVPLDQKLVNLQNTLSNQKGDISAEEYRKTQGQMFEVITDLVKANQNISQTQEDNALQTLLNNTIAVTKEVFNTKVTVQVPDDVKEIGESLFIGATDIEVGNLARQVGRERAFTPDGYKHVATQMAPKFDKFVQAIYKAGTQAGADAITKQGTPGTVVNPLSPGGGGAPPAPSADKNHFDLSNLDKNANAFLASTQVRV